MWRDIREVYTAAWAFALALPLLFLVPALAEFVQHVVEVHIGMMDSHAAARAVAADPRRMAFGFVKTLALTLPGWWFVRYLAWRDPARAVRPERPAIGLWLAVSAFAAAMQAFQLFGPAIGPLVGLHDNPARIADALVAAALSILGIYLTAWTVAWALGNAGIGPIVSARVMNGSFWRTVGYLLACALPLMVLHYALGLGAIGLPRPVMWAMLLADALAVGFLALTLTGASFVAARHAAARRQVALVPA